MRRYNNYHKHTSKSAIVFTDSNASCQDYIDRAKELGEINYWTTEHGFGGDIFEANTLCKKSNINCKFGLEGYIAPNAAIKEKKDDCHIMLIPKTNIARKKLNKVNSRAHIEGFYYRPRIFLEDLLNNFDDDELFITTACVGGLFSREDTIEKILYPLYEKFGKNLLLEVQAHLDESQINLNKYVLEKSKELGLYICHANDSHYIYPADAAQRNILMRGKKSSGDDTEAETFILDYPDIDTIMDRYKQQGVLTPEQAANAIENTLIFDDVENIELDTIVKMPTVYPELSDTEKIQELKNILNKKFKQIVKDEHLTQPKINQYKEEINKEMKVIEETSSIHTADYFLLNNKVVDLGVNKYGGILTRSGRGSGGAFLTNKILGITQIDRLHSDLPIYSERFASSARLLENRAMPDIDFNVVEQEPFVMATKELLGEKGCYPMIAYSTMKENEAFKNVCRAWDMPFKQSNIVSASPDKYREDEVWKPVFQEAQKYIDTVIGTSVHPCAHVLFNGDIEYEIGVIRSKDFICAAITSDEADEYKYLKNDYLVVTVWKIINDVFTKIGKPIIPLTQLLDEIKDNEEFWALFANQITATLNQVSGSWATELLAKYKPKTIEELSMFVASIRPSFEEFRDDFIQRKPYTTGSEDLDNILSSTNHWILFQENLMQYFEWLGVMPAESIGLIKKISKKKIKPEDFSSLTDKLRSNWVKHIGNDNDFDEIWDKMQAMMGYGFNSPHGYATAIDCAYGAYLKLNYPLQYYTVALNIYEKDKETTNRLIAELPYFNIRIEKPKFRFSTSIYSENVEKRVIYKGMSSIKGVSKRVARYFESCKDKKYADFRELYMDLSSHTPKPVDSTQLEALIKLNYFEEFGSVNQLLYQVKIIDQYSGVKQLKIDMIGDELYEILMSDETLYEKQTEKLFKGIDSNKLVKYLLDRYTPENTTTVVDLIKNELQYIGYTDIKSEQYNKNCYLVVSLSKPYTTLMGTIYCINTGEEINVKFKNTNNNEELSEGDLIVIDKILYEQKWIKTDDPKQKFIRSNETEPIIRRWVVSH